MYTEHVSIYVQNELQEIFIMLQLLECQERSCSRVCSVGVTCGMTAQLLIDHYPS
jgi:hypothetical protein